MINLEPAKNYFATIATMDLEPMDQVYLHEQMISLLEQDIAELTQDV